MSTPKLGFPAQKLVPAILTVSAAAATAFCIVVPRIGPLVIAAITLLLSVLVFWRDTQHQGLPAALKATLIRPETPFLAWIIIACLWSVTPMAAFPKALFLVALIIHAIVLVRSLPDLSQPAIDAISKGLLFGFILGGTYLLVEIAFWDVIGRTVLTYFPDLDRGITKHGTMRDGILTRISGAHMTRVAAVFTLLWCPAVLAISLYTKGAIKWLCWAAIVAMSVVILLHPHSRSQTAQLALLVGLLFTSLAAVSPWLGKWVAGACFAGALAFVVPISLTMFAANLHENEDLFRSARARVVIWNFTAERVLENPILGVGTYSTRYLDEQRPKAVKDAGKKLVVEAQTRAHPHNIYLHIWYELGVIGVLTFALLGLSLLLKTDQLPKRSRIFAIGHFAICMTVIAFTYGLWQNWFQAAVVLSTLALVVVARSEPAKGLLPDDHPTPIL